MSHAHFHAQSSARRFGGAPDDYLAIHQWFDATKEMWADARHRALRHHSHGIFECERQFGVTIPNSAGKDVPVRVIAEQHVMEDCGGIIPTIADWLSAIRFEPWMNFGYRRSLAVEHGDMVAPVPNARRANKCVRRRHPVGPHSPPQQCRAAVQCARHHSRSAQRRDARVPRILTEQISNAPRHNSHRPRSHRHLRCQ